MMSGYCIWVYSTLHGKGNDNSVLQLTVFRKSPIFTVNIWRLIGGHHNELTGNSYHLTVSGFVPSRILYVFYIRI